MGEKEDKEKAEKLAAAKKRVAQLQKKKKAGSTAGEKSIATSKNKTKSGTDASAKEDDAVEDKVDAEAESASAAVENESSTTTTAATAEDDITNITAEDPDEAAFNDVINTATINTAHQSSNLEQGEASHAVPVSSSSPDNEPGSSSTTPQSQQHPARQPSVSFQSKIRSTSFRRASTVGPISPGLATSSALSPDGDEIPDIYRKQALLIEELEKENKRLTKETQDGEVRWRKSEEELEELRERAAEERDSGDSNTEIETLRSEIESLRRNQRQSISTANNKSRAVSISQEDTNSLRRELESKDSTISDLQLELSRLRTELSSQSEGCSTHGEQIAALQSSLTRSETSLKKLETELADTKKSLSRATEKAVLDGTERTSKDTQIKSLEREFEALTTTKEESVRKLESLEKKIEAMNKLHRETEQRNATKLSSAEASGREVQKFKAKIETLEKEITRLRESRKRTMSGGGADDGLDELEDEGREKLEKRVRDLESENFDLRRGVWRDRRRELQPNLSGDAGGASNTDGFDDVDLNGTTAGTAPTNRRRSSGNPLLSSQQRQHSGFTQVLTSGLAAFRTSTASPDTNVHHQHQPLVNRPRNDSLLEEFDDDENDAMFDEQAFAAAQREEEMKKMVAHVREVKRKLREWKGWRLDLVDVRRGVGTDGGGFGEVFEI